MRKFILKEYFIAALFLMFMIFSVFSISAAAEGECRIFIENTAADNSGTAAVSLKIENNPGMALGNVKIYFDNKKLTPVSVNKGSILVDSEYFTSNLDDPNVNENELEYISISWMKTSNISGDGEIAEIEFTVSENSGESTDITVEIGELANAGQSNLQAAAGNGTITFSGISGGNDGENSDDLIVGIASNSLKRGSSSVRGDINLSVYSNEAITATAICSIFDGRGSLAAVKILNTTLKNGVNDIVLSDLNADIDAADMCYAKVYIWDGVDTMKPLTGLIKLSL